MTTSVPGAARLVVLTTQRIRTAHAAVDCLFLAVVTAVSLLLYVDRLGFYYDDYSLLNRMAATTDQSLLSLYEAVRPALGERPLAALMFAALYWVFGADALGWHLANAGLLVTVPVLLYIVLRELRLPRVLAVAVPLVYAMLPHYSSGRFWPDLIGVNLSNACYLLSLYATLRAVRSSYRGLAAWSAVAAGSFAVMVFTYELFVPLVAISLALVWWTARRAPEPRSARLSALLISGVLAATVIVTGIVKLTRVAEGGQNGYDIGFENGFVYHLAYLTFGATKVNLGTYFLAFPYVLWWILRNHFDVVNAVVAGISGLLAFVYLWRVGRRGPDSLGTSAAWRALFVGGIVTFVLGYALFLATDEVAFRSAGIDNRVNVAAALGIAAMLIGATAWLTQRLRAQRRVLAFAAVMAGAVASAVLVIGTLGSFWVKAAEQQHAVVTSLMHDAGVVPSSSTVVLDGVCPEIGPAVVFADQWDFRGALQVAYQDPTLAADTATETLRAGARQLEVHMTLFDRRHTRAYEYGPRLFVYDFPRRTLHTLRNRNDAVLYVSSRPALQCPPQRSFAFGFDASRRWSLP